MQNKPKRTLESGEKMADKPGTSAPEGWRGGKLSGLFPCLTRELEKLETPTHTGTKRGCKKSLISLTGRQGKGQPTKTETF